MSTTAQKICVEVLSLPQKARVEIAERILSSLEDQADSNAEKAWKAVVRRRSAEIHSGRAKVRPAAEVMKAALRALK
jgi:putative addiction module component (TIGR02574 family)